MFLILAGVPFVRRERRIIAISHTMYD